MVRRLTALGAVLLPVGFLLVCIGFSPWGLWEPDEGRYADIAREMLESGDFVTPRVNGEIYLDKPPLVYWVTAAGLAAWGNGETGARFGQVLFALGTIGVTWRIGRLLFGDRRGELAALVLASSGLFFGGSHLLTLDLALAFFVTLTVFFFLRGARAGAAGGSWFMAMWAAAAGTLTKGPIGVVLPGLAIAGFLWLRRDGPRLRDLRPLSGALLFLAIAAPWYVVVSLRNPEFAGYFFVHEHLARFFTTVHRRTGPWYYYVIIAFAGLLPWSLLLPIHLTRQRHRIFSRAVARSEAGALVLSWFVPAFLLFSLAQSKLPLYLVPILPAAALGIAACIDVDLRRSGAPGLRALWPSLGVALIAVAAALVWKQAAIMKFAAAAGGARLHAVAAVLLLTGALLWGFVLCRRGRIAAGIALTACLSMAGIHLLMIGAGRINYFNETRYFAALLDREERRDGEPLFLRGCYLRGLPFYQRGPVRLVGYHGDEMSFSLHHGGGARCLAGEDRFLAALSGDGRVFAVVARSELLEVQQKAGRPLFLLGLSDHHALVSNSLGPRRERELAAIPAADRSDLVGELERALALAPEWEILTVEIERQEGVLQLAVLVEGHDGLLEFEVPLTRPRRMEVELESAASEESADEDHLLRLVFPRGAGARVAGVLSAALPWDRGRG
jgi:4-amino-4-deoxy-L-arabinose transferase-like glycosyltransferase